MEIFQDQLLGEGDYINIERQFLYNGHTLTLCHVALNAWDKTEEVRKKIESFAYTAQKKPTLISYKD